MIMQERSNYITKIDHYGRFAKELVDAGATRLGCSASVAIMKGQSATGDY